MSTTKRDAFNAEYNFFITIAKLNPDDSATILDEICRKLPTFPKGFPLYIHAITKHGNRIKCWKIEDFAGAPKALLEKSGSHGRTATVCIPKIYLRLVGGLIAVWAVAST
jgi:hypothetical protein